MSRSDERREGLFYYCASDRSYIVDTSLRLWPEEVKQVIHRADLALNNTFIYTHRWDMERCETEVSFPQGIQWDYRHNGDLEWLVMLNRARYMSDLGQSYWLTGDENYALGYIRILKDWIANNPLTEEEIHGSEAQAYNVKDTWRKLDSGIRITNWLKGYFCVKQSPHWGEEEDLIFKNSARLHGIYLSIAFTSHDRQSNWGFLESNGLLQIALVFPDFAESSAWYSLASERMRQMCKLQVFSDGMHNEQCTMYHHEVLHCLFESVCLAEVNKADLPEELRATLNNMYSASLAFVQPDGRQPMLGDSDNTDIRDVLTRGAVLLKRGDLKRKGYTALDYDGIWYFGSYGVDLYEQLEETEPDFCSIHLAQSGYSFMRSSWNDDANYLLFDAGHMDVIRAHGHDDLLHISLIAHGTEFLVDPGRYTYMEKDERRYFKESHQHNTLAVDGQTQSVYVDSWNWLHVANPTGRFWNSADDYDYAEAGHDGYWRLTDPVQVFRQVLFVKPHYWILVDTCFSQEEHEFTLPFHFAEGVTVTAGTAGEIFAASKGVGPALTITPLTHDPLMTTQISSSWVARNYNEKVSSAKASYVKRSKGTTQFISLMYPTQAPSISRPLIQPIEVLDSHGKRVSDEQAVAFQITQDGREDAILFSKQGARGYQFAGHHLSGSVLLVRREGKMDASDRIWTTEKSYIVKV